jgi:23S rRNA (uracil1939-C5)-methyltransferase
MPQCQVELIVNAPANDAVLGIADAFGPALLRAVPCVSSCILSQRRQRADVAYGEHILRVHGCERICERIGHIVLEAPPAAFFQINTQAAALLHAEVRRLTTAFMRPESTVVWDLYCGVGAMGLCLAERALRVHGFERSKEAVACAACNAARNSLHNCVFTAGDVAVQAKRAARIEGAPDLIIADPPRAGLSSEMAALLPELRAKAIIAVSCDPASQARDIARLAEVYQLRHVQSFDFFPHTPHVENLVLLERRG